MKAKALTFLIAIGVFPILMAQPVQGQESLNIAEVNVEETSATTTITGKDSNGREIGRVEILHGAFEFSGFFAEDREERRVVGRRLAVSVLDQTLHWETKGFSPTLGLPPHPAGQWGIAAFLEDDRVKPHLARWGIGFRSGTGGKKEAPYLCDLEGTHPVDCSGMTECQTLMGGMEPALRAPGTCSRTLAATAAWTVHQRKDAGYHWDSVDPSDVGYDQSFIAQCCAPTKETAVYLKKSCPDSRDCSELNPCKTTCGDVTVPGQCNGCPEYGHFTEGKCILRVENAGWADPRAPHGKKAVSRVCARFAWTCGDGICDVDEDCAGCTEDCACRGENTCVISDAGARCCENGQCD